MSAFFVLLGALRIVAPDCPSAEEIVAHWTELGASAPAGEAYVTVDGDQLRVMLIDPQGNVRADRRLRVSASCSERATVAAVVLAAWTPPASPAPVTTTATIPATAAAASATAAGSSTSESASAPVAVRAAQPRAKIAVELSASFVGAVDPAGFSPSGSADLGLTRRGSDWWGHFSITGGDTRSLTVSTGSAHYARFWASLGPRRRLHPTRALRIDVSAEANLALVYLAGSGFADVHTGYRFDFGLGTGVRLGWRVGDWTPFVGVSLAGWLTRQVLLVETSSQQAQLPRIVGLFSAGISFEP